MDELDEVDKLAVDIGRPRVRRLLVRWGLRDLLRTWDRREAARLAAHLLKERLPRPDIVERLHAAFGFCRATCYALIAEQLKLSNSARDLGIGTGIVGDVEIGSGKEHEA